MDLHEELERQAHRASATAAQRLASDAAADTLVALVGHRRRVRTGMWTGATAACVATAIGVVAVVEPWSPGETSPASSTVTGTVVIDATTPVADAPVTFPRYVEKAPMLCGEDYDVASGATRQDEDSSRWPLTVSASASVMGSDAGALGPGEDLLTWSAEVAPRDAVEDLAFNAYAVVEADGLVVASSVLGGQEPAGGGVLDVLDAPLPGLCGGTQSELNPDDGEFTFHLWVQLVDATGTPVATVVDPVEPVTLTVTGLAEYWASVTSFDGLPNVMLDPLQCGDPSPVEGRLWDDNGYSASLPVDDAVVAWEASVTESGPDEFLVTALIDAPLLPESFAVAQAFGVVDGVVVAVGEVGATDGALDYSARLDLDAPCGVSTPSAMDVYVVQEALVGDGFNAPPQAAVVFRLGPVDVAATAAVSEATAPEFMLAGNVPTCGDEWNFDPSYALHTDSAGVDAASVSVEPAAAGDGWDVTLAAAGEVSPSVGWMAGAYAVADGHVVGVGEPIYWAAEAFGSATIEPAPASAGLCGFAGGEVSHHVVIQAVTLSEPQEQWEPVATWVDPFAP